MPSWLELLNCKHHLQFSILALALAYALCVTWSYSYSSLPSPQYAPRNECYWEPSLPGTRVGNFRSRKQKFPVGTFAPRSENTGERKVPEPFQATSCHGKLEAGVVVNWSHGQLVTVNILWRVDLSILDLVTSWLIDCEDVTRFSAAFDLLTVCANVL